MSQVVVSVAADWVAVTVCVFACTCICVYACACVADRDAVSCVSAILTPTVHF